MKLKLGVIFGGESVEHEISIISAVQAMQSINPDKYEIIPIYITKEKEWYTGNLLKEIENYRDLDSLKRYAKKVVLYNKNGKFILQSKGFFKRTIEELDIAFPIVHGENMEDGTIAGFLNLIGIPFVGSDIYASVVGQDKVFMKQIFEAEGLPITKYIWFFDNEFKDDEKTIINKIKELKFPVIIKPARLGSSVGIGKAKKIEEVSVAIEEAMQYDNKIIVEEMVNNLSEVNCSVLGNYEYQQTSELEEVFSNSDFLSYEEKYIGKGKCKGKISSTKGMASTSRECPAKLGEDMRKEVRDIAKKAFRALNSSGVCRIDLLIDKKSKKVYVNELNTIPGSLAFYLWEPIGKTYQTLLDDVITLAVKEYKKRSKMIFSFETNILKNVGGLKGGKGKLKFNRK